MDTGGRALFQDAPTTRGTRHVKELIEAVERGSRLWRGLRRGEGAGVKICPVTFDYKGKIPIC